MCISSTSPFERPRGLLQDSNKKNRKNQIFMGDFLTNFWLIKEKYQKQHGNKSLKLF